MHPQNTTCSYKIDHVKAPIVRRYFCMLPNPKATSSIMTDNASLIRNVNKKDSSGTNIMTTYIAPIPAEAINLHHTGRIFLIQAVTISSTASMNKLAKKSSRYKQPRLHPPSVCRIGLSIVVMLFKVCLTVGTVTD